MSKVLISSRCAWSLVNYRSGQIKSLQHGGAEVVCAAAEDGFGEQVQALGVRFLRLPVPFRSINPIADLRLFWQFYKLYHSEQPEIVHHFTIKPVIYGSIAARLAGVPRIVNTITGLGFVFSDNASPWLRRLVQLQYRAALSCAHYTFFQNSDDRSLFCDRRIVRVENTGLLPGSGVDTVRFAPRESVPATDHQEPVVFLMIARLLRDKGVYEFIEAARRVHGQRPGTRFLLLGKRDEHNPMVIPSADLISWQESGVIEYLGEVADVRGIIANSDVVVLPSYYREGTPRSLLEAAAMGKPIITTDNVGCREVVEDGVNGVLIPVKSASALVEAMMFMLESSSRRTEMGKAGRQKVVQEFDEQIVIERCRAVYYRGNSNAPLRAVESANEA